LCQVAEGSTAQAGWPEQQLGLRLAGSLTDETWRAEAIDAAHTGCILADCTLPECKFAVSGTTSRAETRIQRSYSERGDIATKVEAMRIELEKKGAGSLLNLLQSQDTRVELARQIENTRNSLAEAKQGLESATADAEAFKQQWSTQLSQELVKARSDLDTAKALYDKALKHQDLVRLTAAEPSVVLTMAKVSVGSVLTPGQTLLTLMPLNAPVEAEANFVSRDIGRIARNGKEPSADHRRRLKPANRPWR
jgi:HlyD family secretion protein